MNLLQYPANPKKLCILKIDFGLSRLIIASTFLGSTNTPEADTVTPQTRGSVDYPSTRGIQVDVGLPDATSENRAESPLYGEL